jgi:Contractile injection system tape measure protein
MTHLINRLRFEADCPDEDMAFNMRHNFAKTLQLQIASVVDRLCTQYVQGDEWIQIDKLEIDMGQLSPDELNTGFDKLFLHKFEKELLAKLSGISPDVRNQSAQQSMLNLLKYFLKNGILPWWADEETINLDEVCKDVFTHSVEQIRKFLMQETTNKVLWQRIAFQLPVSIKKRLAELLQSLALAVESLDKLAMAMLNEINKLSGEQKETVLQKLQKQSGDFAHVVLLNAPAFFAAGDNRKQIKDASAMALLRLFEANAGEYELMKTAYSRLGTTIQLEPVGNSEVTGDGQDAAPDTNKQGAGEPVADLGGNTMPATFKQETTNDETDEELAQQRILVKGAGIVLMAPFLKPFFTKLQLLDGNQWINDDAQVKAIYLLKYIGTGNQHSQEYQLVLEKLLCGMPIGQPLEAAPEFAQAETDEAEELLLSVLEHWKRLKNTSVNGLRESFFKRDGIVTPKESNWQLQVERKTMDVLLDSIPWGFSTITLPWNDYLIFTEW